MILNHNSLSAKLYRWFYGTTRMPNNLCPYFWKLVAAFIFGLPLLIVTTPIEILRWRDVSFGGRLCSGIFLWGASWCVISMLSFVGLFWALPSKDGVWMSMLECGLVCWLFVVGVCIYQLFRIMVQKLKNRRHPSRAAQENRPNLIIEMVKAKYNKYCPKIDWK